MIKKNSESRMIKTNFWYLEASNGDCINYKNETITFGMMKKSDIFFKDENIVPYDLITILNENEEISIYKQISPILITLKKDEKPSLIMVVHKYFDYLGNEVREEKQLEYLPVEGIRYLLEENNFQLNQNGIHQFDICKITENGYKEITGLKYCLDPEIKYMSNNKNIYTNSEFTIDVCLSNVFRKIKVSPSTNYEIITHCGYQYKIEYPYLEWHFASMYDNQIHTSPMNMKKPLFLDEINNTSEKIILDTNLDTQLN